MIDAHLICVEVPPKPKYWPLTTKSNLYINADRYRSHIYPAETLDEVKVSPHTHCTCKERDSPLIKKIIFNKPVNNDIIVFLFQL